MLCRFPGYIPAAVNFAFNMKRSSMLLSLKRADAEALISLLRKEISRGAQGRSLPRKHAPANLFSRAVNKNDGH